MQVLFQGKADFLREIGERLRAAGIKVASGPVPGGWEPREPAVVSAVAVISTCAPSAGSG